MRASLKVWQAQKTLDLVSGVEFQDKTASLDDYGDPVKEPLLCGESRLLAKNIRK